MELGPGDTVAHKYRIERLLGAGGMGSVFVAENMVLRKKVALKVLSDEMRGQQDYVERFMREGVSASQVRHPAIVEVFDAGIHDERPWMAMELLQGESLRDRLQGVERLSARETVAIAGQLLEGLALVHERGIVHRDIKPDNIFLERRTGGAQAKLLDFGIAKATLEANNLTSTGLVLGTAFYLAPEQARDAALVDNRTDLYAVGTVIYECLSGHTPYQARSVTELVAKLFTEDPPDLRLSTPYVGPELAAIVHRCLARDPNHRPSSAAELGAALAAVPVNDQVSRGIPATMAHQNTTAPQGTMGLPSTPAPAFAQPAYPSAPAVATGPGPGAVTEPRPPAKKRGPPWLLIGLGVFALLLLIGVPSVLVLLYLSARSAVDDAIAEGPVTLEGFPTSPSSPNFPVELPSFAPYIQWMGSYNAALADVNRDGTDDVVGWFRELDISAGGVMRSHVGAFDGTTGEEIWRTPVLTEETDFMRFRAALLDTHVVVVTSTGEAKGFHLSNGEQAWSSTVGELADEICSSGPGHALLKLTDGRLQRVMLRDGSMVPGTECVRRADLAIATMQDPNLSGEGDRVPGQHSAMDVETGYRDRATGLTLLFGTRRRGSGIPMVAVDGGWQLELPVENALLAETSAPSSAAVANGILYVSYAMRNQASRITAVDIRTGRRLWDVAVPGDEDNEISQLLVSGGHVYAFHWTWMDGFDAGSGQHKFRTGRWQ